jgi:hypothetical protein
MILVVLLLAIPSFSQDSNKNEQTVVSNLKKSSLVAVIPFRLIRDHIFIEVTIDRSRPLSMFIDSGEPFSAIDNAVANELNLVSQQNLPYLGLGNSDALSAAISKGHEIKIGSALLKNVNLWEMPAKQYARLTGQITEGSIGADLFDQYVVEIDYSASRLRLYDPSSYIPAKVGHSVSISFLSGWMVPLIQSKLIDTDGNVVDASLTFDTGSGPNFLAKSLSDAHPSLLSSGKTIAGPKGAGTNGSISYLVRRLKAIQLGDLNVEEPLVLFSLDSKGLAAQPYYSGSLGGEILEKFKLTVDYKRKNILFEPNEKFAQRVEYNMAGIHLVCAESNLHHFEVDFVAPNSVAAKAKISVGNVVLSVNGKSAEKLTLDYIDQLLTQPGQLKLTLLRGGKTCKAKLRLSPRI